MNNYKQILKRRICIAAFLIPLCLMISVMIGLGVEPFGDKSFLIIDGLHQYMPFYSILYDKLKGGETLLYTFRSGLGINFLSLMTYYLSSPFNLLILFFKKTQLNMAVSWIIVLKIALSGLCAGVYFVNRARRPSAFILALSTAYALSSYMVGYCWNVMWLDAVMIFPLILLGLEKLIEVKDGRLYTVTLFYAMFCNYYIAFMICIFLVLWFVIHDFDVESEYDIIKRFLSFAAHSILAAVMAAVILLPAYLGIKATAAGEDMSLPGHSFFGSWADLLSRQINMAQPISHDNFDGNANLYIGMLALMAVIMFLLNSKISIREKVTKGLLIVFLIISCNEEILNFIWHGFHDQYGIPNRFTFAYGFVLLYMLFMVMENRRGIRFWQPVVTALILGVCIYLSGVLSEEPLDQKIYIAGAALVFVYAILFILLIRKRRARRIIMILFTIISLGEICTSAIIGFDHIGQINVPKFFSKTETMDALTQKYDDGTFFRSELASAKIVDENAWYDMKAVGLFGSMARHDIVKRMDSLGFYTGCNEYLFKGSSPVTNLLFGIRYLYYHQDDTVNSEFLYRESRDGMDVFENPVDNLSLGYLMNRDVENWSYESAYPFLVLNDLCKSAWNTERIFEMIPLDDPVTKGTEVNKTNEGEYHFKYIEKDDENIVFTTRANRNLTRLFIHYDGTQVENTQIKIGKRTVQSGDVDSRVLMLGNAPKDSVIRVAMKLKGENEEGYVRVSLFNMNQALFEEMSERVTNDSLKIRTFSDDHIEGTINAREDQLLFFSIPYDEGWQVKIDGKTQETQKVGDAFLSVVVSEGPHEVTLDYTPPGYKLGRSMSLAGTVIYIITLIWYRKRRSQ